MPNRTIDFVLFRERDAWVARGLNLEVSSCGTTWEEARARVLEAVALLLDGEDLDNLPPVNEAKFDQAIV